MEPFVVIVKELKDGKISLTESELKLIIKQAYNEGYSEGNKKNWWNYPITYTTATNAPQPVTIDYSKTNTPPLNPNIQITCDNDRNIISNAFTCEAHNDIGG